MNARIIPAASTAALLLTLCCGSARASDLVPLGEWGLNEGIGSTAHDSVNGYDGIIVQDGASPTWGAGYLGFQGASDIQGRVEIPSIPSLGSFGSFAVECRFRLTPGSSSHQDLASEWGPTVNLDDEWILGITQAGKPRFWVRGPTEPWENIQAIGEEAIPTDEWHVLKGVFSSGQSVDLWLDGQLIASQPTSWNYIHTSSYPMWIGNMHWLGSTWHAVQGDIDYVKALVAEPATLSLLALGGLAIIRRCRAV